MSPSKEVQEDDFQVFLLLNQAAKHQHLPTPYTSQVQTHLDTIHQALVCRLLVGGFLCLFCPELDHLEENGKQMLLHFGLDLRSN